MRTTDRQTDRVEEEKHTNGKEMQICCVKKANQGCRERYNEWEQGKELVNLRRPEGSEKKIE